MYIPKSGYKFDMIPSESDTNMDLAFFLKEDLRLYDRKAHLFSQKLSQFQNMCP